MLYILCQVNFTFLENAEAKGEYLRPEQRCYTGNEGLRIANREEKRYNKS